MERILLAALLTSTRKNPAGYGREPNRQPGDQLVVDGGPELCSDLALDHHWHRAGALYHQGYGCGRC